MEKAVKQTSVQTVHHPSLIAHRSAVRRILIRAPNWVGDAVISEPALAAVRELFRKAEITLLARPAIAELFGGHPAFDRIAVYDHRRRHAGLAGKWALAGELRRFHFDLAILFQNAFEAAVLAFLAGIPQRYGYATDGRGWLLTKAVGIPKRLRIEHQVQYYLNLLRPLGADAAARSPRLFLSDEEEQAMNQRLAESGLAESDVAIGLNPGSTYGGAKRWLPERYAETADRLAEDYGARVVIVGAPGEEPLGQAIADAMRNKPIVLSGRTTIRELMAAIKRCRLFLTNDTGPMHIAAAFGVPVVAVFGPTDSRTTAPFGSGHLIVRQPAECSPCLLRECPIDHRCMTRVTVDHVYEAAAKQLQTLGAECRTMNVENRGQHSQAAVRRSLLIAHRSPLQGVFVCLDRDGTLNRDTGYVKTPEELDLFPDAVEAVARLNRAGARVVLVTNQSGIARGILTRDSVEAVHGSLCERLKAGGARLDGIYYCPHHPDEGCACRKPGTLLIKQAMIELGLDRDGDGGLRRRAYVVGDQERDMELARRIGARGVLVMTGPASLQAREHLEQDGRPPDFVAAGLSEAVEWIFEDAKARYSLTVNRRSPGLTDYE